MLQAGERIDIPDGERAVGEGGPAGEAAPNGEAVAGEEVYGLSEPVPKEERGRDIANEAELHEQAHALQGPATQGIL